MKTCGALVKKLLLMIIGLPFLLLLLLLIAGAFLYPDLPKELKQCPEIFTLQPAIKTVIDAPKEQRRKLFCAIDKDQIENYESCIEKAMRDNHAPNIFLPLVKKVSVDKIKKIHQQECADYPETLLE